MAYTVRELQNGRWVEIENPSQKDVEFLRENFPFFHLTNLEDSQEHVQQSKLDIYDQYMFMSVAVPLQFTQGKRLSNLEFSFFLTEGAIVTITQEKTELFKQEQREGDMLVNERLQDTPQLMAYRFLEKLYDTSQKNVELIGKAINDIDEDILDVRSSSIIRNISILQRNLIYFMTTLDSALPLIMELEQKNVCFGSISMKEYWGDLVDTLKQQRDMLDDYDRFLTKLAKAHENVVGYHTNHVIHLLTIISVIFLPLNLISGIFGMNFAFIPAAEHPIGFFIALLMMLSVAITMIAIFKYKKWL
jgi:magnesium transporter